MSRTKRRHNAGFGYIGSGNNHSVFNRKPRKAFSEIKEKLDFESEKKYHLTFKDEKLSLDQKQIIKNKIRNSEKKKSFIATILSLIGLIVIIFLAKYMIEGVLFRH